MRQLVVEAGIASGMKVLDVGCGAGDVSFLVADVVGPAGTVIGLDRNADLLETASARAKAAGRTNVTFVAGDLRNAPVPDDFDALVGRLVLLYLRDAAEGIRQACRHVRPGGIVVFDEPDMTEGHIAIPPSEEHTRVGNWIRAAFSRSGADIHMGSKLAETFVEAGLPRPQMYLFAPMGSGPDWVGYEYLADCIRILLPTLVQYGIANADDVDIDTLANRLRYDVVSQCGSAIILHHVGAWARKPSP
jgi:SAM-dependent methyltransferase